MTQAKIELYQRVALTRELPEHNLCKGDVAVHGGAAGVNWRCQRPLFEGYKTALRRALGHLHPRADARPVQDA